MQDQKNQSKRLVIKSTPTPAAMLSNYSAILGCLRVVNVSGQVVIVQDTD